MFSVLGILAVLGQHPILLAPASRVIPIVVKCEACGVRVNEIDRLIMRLQTSPRWRDRDKAALDLRRVNWRCHPEAALSLVDAMLRDCEEEVREEAAESLTKMAPCLPEVHASLDRAARRDPDHATRKWARRGLNALGKTCIAACSLCGPTTVKVVGPIRVQPRPQDEFPYSSPREPALIPDRVQPIPEPRREAFRPALPPDRPSTSRTPIIPSPPVRPATPPPPTPTPLPFNDPNDPLGDLPPLRSSNRN